jgi:iron complex transport system substrate-binding protein
VSSRRRCHGLGAVLALMAAPVFAQAPRPEAPRPRRIVSTSPSITETLFALGLGDRVVGVSRYCRFPEPVEKLPKVGTFLKPDVESIARLAPDLVLVHAKADGLEGRLTAVGLRYALVDRGEGLAAVYSSITAIADAARVPERGRALVAKIGKELARMHRAAGDSPHPRVLLIVGRRPGTLSDIVGVGRKAYLGELLEIAGGKNVLDDPALPEYPRISLETVVRLRPDVIIDTGDMGDTPEERERAHRANLALWRGNSLVSAAGIKRIHAATTDALVVPGPRVTEATEWLRSLIQDDRVP